MEMARHAIGMRPVQSRLKNLTEVGNPDTKKPFSNPGSRDVIVAARDGIGWKDKWHAPKANQVRPGGYHGIGLAAHACSHRAGRKPPTGQLIIHHHGNVEAVSTAHYVGR